MALVLGATSFPSPDFKFSSPASIRSKPKPRRRNPRLSAFDCRGGAPYDHHPCSSSSSDTNASCSDGGPSSKGGSWRRRGFALAVAASASAVPFVLPFYRFAEAIDADTAESTVIQNGVRSVLSKAKAAGILRMVFHDAGTFELGDNSGGMNGSIVYELDRPENAGLKKSAKVLEKAKKEIEKTRQVSWADLIAVAGAEAVSLCGGPVIPIRLGRIDARVPDPEGKLPQESLDVYDLKMCFLKKGFSTQELVTLSGAHTLGNKGFGNPNVFDNTYFKILLEKPWASSAGMSNMVGLPTDRALIGDDECLRWIKLYATDEVKFFDDFTNAYVKLVNSGASWRSG